MVFYLYMSNVYILYFKHDYCFLSYFKYTLLKKIVENHDHKEYILMLQYLKIKVL